MMIDNNGWMAQDGSGQAVAQDLLLGYANDMAMTARNWQWLQNALDLFVNILRSSGFEVNIDKTKLTTCHPDHICLHLSTPAYTRRVMGNGPHFLRLTEGKASLS